MRILPPLKLNPGTRVLSPEAILMSTAVIAYFDYDDTLIQGDSILYWLQFYYGKRPWLRPFLLLHHIGLFLAVFKIVSPRFLKRLYYWPLSWESEASRQELAAAFVREDLSHRFHRPVLERLWVHHLLGHQVVVVSASADFYLKHLASLLPPCRIEGTHMIFGEGWLKFPRFEDVNLKGDHKIRRLKSLGLMSQDELSYAYSDHHSDLPLLCHAELGIAVRPDSRLREEAASLTMPVWDWARNRSAFSERMSKIFLVAFAWDFAELPGGVQMQPLLPGTPGHENPEFLEEHKEAMRERVKVKYPRGNYPRVYREIFGWSKADTAGLPE
jgi:HAD superfamily phosphoserine phosphatase-like hydrolase